jgi:2',3'-cyclic-nucleotide 2'-phosphodiesterase/3'-nucleotidase
VEPVQAILDAVDSDHRDTLDYMAQRVGEITANINSYFAVVQDDPSVQVVNNAQAWYVENIVRGTELEGLPILSAAAPFKAGGRGGPDYYTDVPAGDIALKNVADLYIYPNDLKVVKLTGEQVVEWLERSAGQFNTIDPAASGMQPLVDDSFPTYNFDVIDGISYLIDVTVPPRYNSDGSVVNDQHRVVDVQFQGESIDPDQEFLIATNNYRAGGGGSFPGLDGSTVVIDAPDKNRDVIANYLLSQGTFNPSADNNWQFTDWGNADVMFKTSPKAEELATENMKPGELDEAGFRVFTFN